MNCIRYQFTHLALVLMDFLSFFTRFTSTEAYVKTPRNFFFYNFRRSHGESNFYINAFLLNSLIDVFQFFDRA